MEFEQVPELVIPVKRRRLLPKLPTFRRRRR
nr:MAG TPA: hypothetical protein [Inoviridae sp.]